MRGRIVATAWVVLGWCLPTGLAAAQGLPNVVGNPVNRTSPLQSGMMWFDDRAQAWMFVDAFMQARRWEDLSSCDPCAVDADGWPEEVATTILFTGEDDYQVAGEYPGGEYVVSCGGSGTLFFGRDASGSLACPGSGTLAVTPTTNGGIEIRFEPTSPSEPIRDVRVIMPGGVCRRGSDGRYDWLSHCATPRSDPADPLTRPCDAGWSCEDFTANAWDRFSDLPSAISRSDGTGKATFHPAELQNLRHYRRLRYMNRLAIPGPLRYSGGNQVVEWADRTPISRASWNVDFGGNGSTTHVPIEVLLRLSNVLEADAWMNVPHRASDAYMTAFAALARDTLNSNLALWIEYTNEAWNQAFSETYDWIQGRANAEFGSAASAAERHRQWYGLRVAQMCDLFEGVFAATGDQARLVCVMSGWFINPSALESSLHCPLWSAGAPCWQHNVDAVAIAGYIDHSNQCSSPANTCAGLDADRATKFCSGAGCGVGAHLALVDGDPGEPTLPLVTYEGGQSIEGTDPDCAAAQVHACMDTVVYTPMLEAWRDLGPRVGHFSHHLALGTWFPPFGWYGAKQYQTDARAEMPKYDALVRFVENNDCWWPDCARVDPPDTDADTVRDAHDNCPTRPNTPQWDSGGIASVADPAGSTPDGAGDACQCGDPSDDGRGNAIDLAWIRGRLAGLAGAAGAPDKCSVIGPVDATLPPGAALRNDCNLADLVVLRRHAADLPPLAAQVCEAAL